MPRRAGTLVRATCCVCGKVELSTGACHLSRCTDCKHAGKRHPDWYEWPGGEIARQHVSAAISNGSLPPARECKCVDCGAPASDYDHRDYNQPLKVEPVCRGCNLRRGPAIPRKGAIPMAVDNGFIPYQLRRSAARILSALGLSTDLLAGMPTKLTLEHWEHLAPLIDGAIEVRA